MRAVIQRVSRASVSVGERIVGKIERGLLVLISVGVDDDASDAGSVAEKIAGLRIFPDDDGLMNRSVSEVGGAVLLISQFTLHGDARRGRRPSFVTAAKEPSARELYELAGRKIQATGLPVAYGEFGAQMEVESINSGPVTILIDSKRAF